MYNLLGLALIWLSLYTSAASAPAHVSKRSTGSAKAIYFMSNKLSGNEVHALPVAADGQISHGRVTSTGGVGSKSPSIYGLTDALNSQGSIALLDNYLFLVNAGSDTLSMMEIDAQDPLEVTLVGEPICTLGDWPNSVVVSKELMLACVSNSGTKSGIACFKITPSGLEPTDNFLRPLPLYPTQATPPNGPFNTVSQVFFSTDTSTLFATVKGTPKTNATNTGYLAAFPVSNGAVSHEGTFSSPEGTAVLFGSVALPGDRILASDAAFGAALLQVHKDGTASTVKKTAIPNNAATCWTAQSDTTGLIFTTDDGNEQLAAFEPTTGDMIKLNVLTTPAPNLIELHSSGNLFYVLSHGNATIPVHVIVLEGLGKGGGLKTLQVFEPFDVNIRVEGMAVLES